jgi:hypothetical protein
MGFWSRFTGKKSAASESPDWAHGHEMTNGPGGYVYKQPVPHLVLLMTKPIGLDVPQLRGIVKSRLGVVLPTGEPDATEFVTGEWPFFFVQFGGRHLQLKLIPKPYFDPFCLDVLGADPKILAEKIKADATQTEAVRKHGAWVSVSYMASLSGEPEDPYHYVGKLLSAFGIFDDDIHAILWPVRNEIRLWEMGMNDELEEGRPLELFQSDGDRQH